METGSQAKIFRCRSYLQTFKDGLAVMRDEFCDARLVAGGKKFQCHKIILAAHSKYFYSIFVQNFRERESEEIRMPPEIDAEAMQTLLTYFYSGELVLSAENIESVFRATDYLRLDPLLEFCTEYMQDTLDSSNCIQRYIVADSIQYSSHRLDVFKETASALIVAEAVKDPDLVDFLSLSVELITKIVKSNNQPEKAEDVYTIILKWVGHNEENRRELLDDLLQTLPVEGISNDFFTRKMRNEELLRKDVKSLQWLLDSFMSRISNSIQPSSIQPSSIQPSSIRPNSIQPNLLFIAENNFPADRNKCFYLNLPYPTPLKICDLPEITRFSAVCHKKRMYLLCGDNEGESFRLYDPQASWVESDLDLDFGRFCAGCVVLGDDLFVLGGLPERRPESCMKFNFGSERKEYLPAMRHARWSPGVAVYANSVYVACGFEENERSSSIERFDPREGRWFAVGKYKTKIEHCSSATLGYCLYSCDYENRSAAHFDFRINRSQEISSDRPDECRPRAIASVDGNLYGVNYEYIVKYDSMADKWNVFCSGVDLSRPIIVPWV